MSCLSDILDFNDATFERKRIDGGQTEGFVTAAPSVTYNPLTERKRGYGGADYAHVIRQREEEKERLKMKVEMEGENDPMKNVDDLTSMGTIPNVRELEREELTQVYENYDFEPKKTAESTKLAVFDHRDSILSMIRTYRVCVIKGNTGCGKTTQIPQMILDSHFKDRKHCNIIVTQPRRIAAISVAKRVSDERNWSLGTIVGYQVGLEKKGSEDTRLMYCTTGVLLQRLINVKHMNDYTHVILDEVHERDQDMDFLMLVVRKFQRTVSPHVKIILMSATINTSIFTQYFSTCVTDEPPVLEVGQKTNFPVSIYYLDRLEERLGQFPDISEDQPRIAEKAYDYVVKLIEVFDIIDDAETKSDVKKKGSVLVFLPGIHEIEMLFEALETTQLKLKKRIWWICPLHSTITADEQMKAFRVPPPEFRKIILSTNIAESSITVPDIKYVIDFCLTKVMYADPETNLSSLHLAWASKNQCEQRAGRVGRVMAGRVYRLLLKSFYDYCIQDETKPEILRCPLERVVLKSKLLEMGEPMEILALAMDPPDLNRLEQTILILKETGALLMTVNGEYYHLDGDLTWLGKIMAALPLDIKISKLIILGHIFSILEDTIIMGCAMTVKSMFSKPFKQDLMAYISKLTWADSTCSDSIACLNAYRLWRFCKTSGKFDISSGGGAKSWGKRFFIQLNAMREVARLQDEVTMRLKNQFGIEESKGPNRVKWSKVTRPLIMKIVLAGAFYPHYFVRSQSGGQIDESAAVKVLGGRDPFSTVYLTNFPPNQPGPLYANSIREHFENCGVAKSNIKISFDCSSKVYIEFKGNDHKQLVEGDDRNFTYAIPGKISMAVYRALKMRHYTSSSVHIQVLPPDEAKRRMKEIEQKEMEKKQANKLSILPSVATSYIEIRISHVNDPGDFFAQYSSMDYHKKLIDIHHHLNSSGTLKALDPKELPQLNKMYAAPFKDPDGTNDYYRARVIDRESHTVKVLFIDYGNVETVTIQSLRKFDPILQLDGVTELEEMDLENEPNLAFNCTLALIQPSLTKNYRAMWSDEANDEFKKLCGQSRKLLAKVYSVVDNVASLEVYIANPNNHLEPRRFEEDARTMITINRRLVDRRLAEWNEESYLSKVDHDLRVNHQNSDLDYNSYESENWSAKPLTASQWTDYGDMPPLPKQQCRKPVRLKGPDSPLEMTVYSCIQSNMKKTVNIEHDSVNSVLLDTHPHDPHERMLIASSVGQSPNGERLTLRYTTLLPNIHGLSALICLLFCPYAEFRINRAATRLTGAICGLGCDPNTNEAFFPENDMEIMFDTTFTMEDVLMINKLRYWMSIFLSEGESHNPAEFTDGNTIEHQNKVKELILKLLEQLGQQKTERVESHCDPYRWGQISSNRLLNPGVNSDWAVYHLHYGVSLEEKPKNFTPDARLKKNLVELKEIAAGRAPIKGAMCDLCQVSFDNVRSLKLHLQSTQHCELVDRYKLDKA